jgi:hypothetical protein
LRHARLAGTIGAVAGNAVAPTPRGNKSAQILPRDCCLRALLQSHHVGLLVSIESAEGGMPMNSRHTVSQSEFSRGRWADEPPEPPTHPTELSLVARVRSWLSNLAPPTRVWSPLTKSVPLTRARSWLSELAPLTFARYAIAFFIGVVATVAWQSSGGGAKEETVAATAAALDSVRQSIDRLAAEVTKMRAVEQDVLERISAPPPQPVATPPPQPVATPPRNPAQRPSSVR